MTRGAIPVVALLSATCAARPTRGAPERADTPPAAVAMPVAQPPVLRCGEPIGGPAGGTRQVAAAALGHHLYVFGGDGPSRGASRFDVRTRQWEALPPMPRGQDSASAAVAANQVVVGGGGGPFGGGDDMIQIFDPATCKWSIGPTFPWLALHPAVAASGSRVYVLGGETWFIAAGEHDSRSVTDFASFEIGGATVEVLPSATLSRAKAAAVVTEGAIWVLGGAEHRSYAEDPDADLMGILVSAIERFDLAAGTWGEPMPYPDHRRAVAVVWGERIVSFTQPLAYKSTVYVFDPETGETTDGEEPADFDVVQAAGVIDGTIYVLASTRDRPAEVRTYDPTTGSWTPFWQGQ